MLTYHALDTSTESDWLTLLNSEAVRKHLLPHPLFTEETLRVWLNHKTTEDAQPGCRVRAIQFEDKLVGWCGIQLESGHYELALVLSPDYWGYGREVMKQMMQWAQTLGHSSLLAHFPKTRPQTKALERLFGQPVGEYRIEGCVYNTYQIDILTSR